MQITDIPFGTTTWADVEVTEHAGEMGVARWRTRQFGGGYSLGEWQQFEKTINRDFGGSKLILRKFLSYPNSSRPNPSDRILRMPFHSPGELA